MLSGATPCWAARRLRAPQRGVRRVLVVCVFVGAMSLYACSAPAQDLPKDAASDIRTVWADVRHHWKHDARFLYLGFVRDSANEGFETEYVFGADSAPGVIYHVTRGPQGVAAGQRHPLVQPVIGKLLPEDIVTAGMLTSKVIAPAQAIAIAVRQGMKGHVLKVTLEAWGGPPLEVWRVVPDNDPALDPNDPVMKNYIIDAMTGAFYSDSYFTRNHVNPVEYNRNLAGYVRAVVAETMDAARER
jgi:hypothetical protein